MNRIKRWLSNIWTKFKAWLVGILVAIGLIVPVVLYAEAKTFNWTNPVMNVDGSAYDAATEQAGARIYCNVDAAAFVPETPDLAQSYTWVAVAANGDTGTTADFSAGTYGCFATVINMDGRESDPSNVIEFTIMLPRPSPPVLEPMQ